MEGRKKNYVNMSLHNLKICKTYMYLVLLQAISVANYFFTICNKVKYTNILYQNNI